MEARDAYASMINTGKRELLMAAEDQAKSGVAKWFFNERGNLCSIPADGSGVPEEHPEFFSAAMVHQREDGSRGDRGEIAG